MNAGLTAMPRPAAPAFLTRKITPGEVRGRIAMCTAWSQTRPAGPDLFFYWLAGRMDLEESLLRCGSYTDKGSASVLLLPSGHNESNLRGT